MGDLHTRTYRLQDDRASYFVRTKAGALCFRQGTEVTVQKEEPGNGKAPAGGPSGPGGQRRPLEVQQQQQQQQPAAAALAVAGSASTSGGPLLRVRPRGARGGKRLVKCVCRPGWHGPYCGVPTMVYHSNMPTKERLTPREIPRRVINAINVNHEFDLLHARFHELRQAVDLFLICESNFTAYGERRPLRYVCVCVRVCACVRMCARVCARWCCLYQHFLASACFQHSLRCSAFGCFVFVFPSWL